MVILVYISIFFISYTYILYPLLLSIFSKKEDNDFSFQTSISFIIPAYNELPIIHEKINNTLAVCGNFEAQIILVSNGSDDGTEDFESDAIIHLRDVIRKGKPNAINKALEIATGNIIIISDANTMITPLSIEKIMSHFENKKIGMVCGEKAFSHHNKEVAVESAYWKYESLLKQNESNFYTVVGAAGELFAIRKELCQAIPENVILDDFYLSMLVAKNGYLVKYEKEAKAKEKPSSSLHEEYSRRVRIASGVMQWLFQYGFKDFWKYNTTLKWQFFSHRFCRWIVSPLSFLGIFISAFFLGQENNLYHYLLFISLGLVSIGWVLQHFKIYSILFYWPFYFVFVHFCLLIGYFKYFFNVHTILWNKATRI